MNIKNHCENFFNSDCSNSWHLCFPPKELGCPNGSLVRGKWKCSKFSWFYLLMPPFTETYCWVIMTPVGTSSDIEKALWTCCEYWRRALYYLCSRLWLEIYKERKTNSYSKQRLKIIYLVGLRCLCSCVRTQFPSPKPHWFEFMFLQIQIMLNLVANMSSITITLLRPIWCIWYDITFLWVHLFCLKSKKIKSTCLVSAEWALAAFLFTSCKQPVNQRIVNYRLFISIQIDIIMLFSLKS